MILNRQKIQRMMNGSATAIGGSGSGSSGGSGGGGGSADYAAEAGHAQEADHATSADSATEAANLTSNSTDWQKIMRKDIAQTAADVITFAKGIISTLKSYFNGGIEVTGGSKTDTLQATGNTTVGGTLGVTGKITGTEAEFQNLTVTKEAQFMKLVVDELASNKGAIIITSANCVAESVQEDQSSYTIYFACTDRDGNAIINPFVVGDQALCLTFKAEGTGTFADAKNRYYWRKVTGVYSNITYNDETYHAIVLSKTIGEGSTVPATGDNIIQLGYQGTTSIPERQTAVILSSYPTMDTAITPPSLAFYKGINDFTLSSHRYTWIDGEGTLHAIDGEFDGIVKAKNFYQTMTLLWSFRKCWALNLDGTHSVYIYYHSLCTDQWFLDYQAAAGVTYSVGDVIEYNADYDPYDDFFSDSSLFGPNGNFMAYVGESSIIEAVNSIQNQSDVALFDYVAIPCAADYAGKRIEIKNRGTGQDLYVYAKANPNVAHQFYNYIADYPNNVSGRVFDYISINPGDLVELWSDGNYWVKI